MRKEEGFTMPGTLLFLFLLFSFFIYQINSLVTDQMFYKETETLFLSDEVMQQAVIDVKREIRGQEENGEIFYLYEAGEVTGNYVLEQGVASVTLRCVVKGNRLYTASFQYNKSNDSITNWRETRS